MYIYTLDTKLKCNILYTDKDTDTHVHICMHARMLGQTLQDTCFYRKQFLSHCLSLSLSLSLLKHSWTFTQQNHIMDYVCSSVCAVLLSIQSCLLSLWNNHATISCMPNSFWNYEMGIKWKTDIWKRKRVNLNQ